MTKDPPEPPPPTAVGYLSALADQIHAIAPLVELSGEHHTRGPALRVRVNGHVEARVVVTATRWFWWQRPHWPIAHVDRPAAAAVLIAEWLDKAQKPHHGRRSRHRAHR